MNDEMTMLDVLEILNTREHRGRRRWYMATRNTWGDDEDRDTPAVFGEGLAHGYSAFEACAVAREYLRLDGEEAEPALADEVASVLVQLDELAETWGDEAMFRRCRDRLRAAVEIRELAGRGEGDK